MTFPVSITIGTLSVPLHVVTEILAFFIGFRYYLYLRAKKGDIVTSNSRYWVIMGAIFGSLIGSRVVGGFENPPALFRAQNILLYFYFNKTILGGLIGGLFGVEVVKKIIGEKKATGDLFVYPIILSLIIGRLGCFSMGIYEETYGKQTHIFTGMNLGDGLMRHPVILYEIVFLIFTCILIKVLSKKFTLADGAAFKVFLISYFVFRFFCDFLKPVYIVVWGLSTIQLTCVLGLVWYYKYIIDPQRLIYTYTKLKTGAS